MFVKHFAKKEKVVYIQISNQMHIFWKRLKVITSLLISCFLLLTMAFSIVAPVSVLAQGASITGFAECDIKAAQKGKGTEILQKCIQSILRFLFVLGLFIIAFKIGLVAFTNINPNSNSKAMEQSVTLVTDILIGLLLIGAPGLIIAIFNPAALNLNFLDLGSLAGLNNSAGPTPAPTPITSPSPSPSPGGTPSPSPAPGPGGTPSPSPSPIRENNGELTFNETASVVTSRVDENPLLPGANVRYATFVTPPNTTPRIVLRFEGINNPSCSTVFSTIFDSSGRPRVGASVNANQAIGNSTCRITRA